MAIDDKTAPDYQGGEYRMPPVRFLELIDDGAITIAAGVVSLNKAGVIAATIDDPPAGMNGQRLTIISKTAQAHTLTYTTGFNGGGAASDVGTFGGAIDDSIDLVAMDSVWYVAPGGNTNVTLA